MRQPQRQKGEEPPPPLWLRRVLQRALSAWMACLGAASRVVEAAGRCRSGREQCAACAVSGFAGAAYAGHALPLLIQRWQPLHGKAASEPGERSRSERLG